MARVFECDRCRQQQVDTDEAAIVRVTAADITTDEYMELELCDGCYHELREWIDHPEKKPKYSKGMEVKE